MKNLKKKLRKGVIGVSIIALFVTPYILEGIKSSKYKKVKNTLDDYVSTHEIKLKEGETYWTPTFKIQKELEKKGLKIKDPSIIHKYLTERLGKK